MSHRIEGSDRVIYTQGDKPWHDLASFVGQVKTVKEMIGLAKLAGWNLQTIRLSVPNHVTAKWEEVDAWAVVRGDTGKIVAHAVGRQYRPIQNETAAEFLSPFVDSGLVTLETAGSLRDGGRVWVQGKVNGQRKAIVGKADDFVDLYLTAAWGHDGSLSIHGGFTGGRFVCDNTLSAGISDGGKSGMVRIRHTSGAERALKAASDTIARAGAEYDKAIAIFRALAGKPTTERQIRAFIDKVFPPAKLIADETPSPELAAKMAEWDDGPTSPDVTAPEIVPAAVATPKATVVSALESGFAALMAKPVAILAKPAESTDATVERLLGRKAGTDRRVADNIVEIFESGGRRGDLNLQGVRGTAWAAYNAVTEYQTWHRGANAENRMNALYFQDAGMPARTLAAARDTFLG